MPRERLISDAQIRFSKELISLSQEIQQLEAQLQRTIRDHLMPGTIVPEELGHEFAIQMTANMEKLRCAVKPCGALYKEAAKKLLKYKKIKL